MRRKICIKTQFEGIHKWPEAPVGVKFLRSLHRHTFFVTIQISVSKNDRDIEFILAKRQIQEFLESHYTKTSEFGELWHLGRQSCEDVAECIIEYCKVQFGLERSYIVEVSEDNENSAILEFEPKLSEQMQEAKGSTKHFAQYSFAQYQRDSYCAIQQDHRDKNDALVHWVTGLTEEAGEVAGCFKHLIWASESVPKETIAIEIGDVLWYLSALCTELEINLADVAKLNLSKLQHRYPKGQFDAQQSAQRHQLDSDWKQTPEYWELLQRILNNRGESK